MKKLLMALALINSVYASGYIQSYVDNNNQSGNTTPTLELGVSNNVIGDLFISNALRYYYDNSQWVDNNTMLTYEYGKTGLFTTVGYKAYYELDSGRYNSRMQFTSGYSSNLTDNLSQSTYISGYNDGTYKILLENDLHYKYNETWSIDTNLSAYKYVYSKIINDSYNIDGLVKLNYNLKKDFSVYVSQELSRNLMSNAIINTTEAGINYSF
jgi:hypothetical protein